MSGSSQIHALHLRRVAAEAIQAASLALAVEGDKMNVFSEGLRTTLIVVVTSPVAVGYSYIGDGGGCVIRRSGEVFHFLVPQKAFKGVPNILAASLGPTVEGAPVVGSIPRSPGDLVVIGTDGVFDRFEQGIDSFPERTNCFLAALQHATTDHCGQLQIVVDQILNEMAEARDNYGYICDDNLTLAILGDGKAPVAPKSKPEPQDVHRASSSARSSLAKAEV